MKIKALLLSAMLFFLANAKDDISTKLELLLESLTDSVSQTIKSARVAVIPFDDNTPNKSYGLFISDYLLASFEEKKMFVLIDRAQLQHVVEEMEISMSGLAEDSVSLEIGKVLTAEYIISGSVSESFGKIRIVAKLINTETTKLISSAMVSVSANKLDDFSKELLSEKNRIVSSLFRSTLIPGWGQFYSGKNGRGAVALVASLAALGTEIGFLVSTNNAHTKRDNFYDYQFSQEYAEKLKNKEYTPDDFDLDYQKIDSDYSDKHKRSVIMGAVTGGIWMLNILDAAIAGAQNKKRLSLYFSYNQLKEININVSYLF